MAEISIYLRTDRMKFGLAPVQMKVWESGKKSYYHKVKHANVNPDLWDADTARVSDSHENYSLINRKIKTDKLKIETYLLEMDTAGIIFSKEYLEKKMNGFNENSVYDFWQDVIDSRDGTIEPDTLEIYKTELSKIKQFKSTLLFGEVTLAFLEQYEAWCKNVRGNKPNTIGKSMKKFNYVMDRAKATIGVNNNAFDLYKKPSQRTKRAIFELDDLDNMLKVLYKKVLPRAKQEVLSVFCLQALTGLRFGDAVRFNRDEFISNNRIIVNTDKTGELVYIPIVGRLQTLLEFMDYAFPELELTNTNRHLKSIATYFSLKINLSTHVAVHTFCTLSLEMGVPLEVIQKIRGHTDIRTTQIYTQVRNGFIDQEMQKWDGAKVVQMKKGA